MAWSLNLCINCVLYDVVVGHKQLSINKKKRLRLNCYIMHDFAVTLFEIQFWYANLSISLLMFLCPNYGKYCWHSFPSVTPWYQILENVV